MLRWMKAIAPEGDFKLNFRIEETSEGPPSLETQKALIDPFRPFLVRHQSSKIWGAIEPGYALSLKEIIRSEIKWVRGAIWETHELVMARKARGDQYFELGNWRQADNCYQSGKQLLTIGRKSSPSRILDLTMFTLEANDTLNKLRSEDFDGVLEKTRVFIAANLHNVSKEIALFVSRVYAYRAWALTWTGKSKEAVQAIREAAKASPLDEAGEDYGKMMMETLGPVVDARETKINTLFFGLGRLDDQITIPLPPTSPSDTIAGERYVLQELGYQGDYLPAIKEERPLNSEEMGKLTQEVEKYKATVSPGSPFKVKVAEGGRLVY